MKVTKEQVVAAVAVLNAFKKGQATLNAKKECPECGGEMDQDGECEECGYVENDAGTVKPLKAVTSGSAEAESRMASQTRNKGGKVVKNREDHMFTNNDSPSGHLSDAPRAQVQAAMAAMSEGGGGGSKSRSAFQSGKLADSTGKQSHHKAAAQDHREAAAHHREEGNHEMAKVHSDLARSHSQKGNRATTNKAWLEGLITNCTCESTANELRKVLNEADSTGDGSFDAAVVSGREGDGDEDDDDLGYPDKTKKKAKAKISTNAWLADQPDEVRETFVEAQKVVQNKKASIVRRLTANIGDPQRQATKRLELMQESLPKLQGLLELIGNQQEERSYDPLPMFGATGVDLATNSNQDDVLDLPVLNFKSA